MKKITVELNEEISTNLFFLIPGAGTFKHNSYHMHGREHLTSNLVLGAGNLTNRDFKSPNARGWPGGEMLKFRIDRYVTVFLF